MQRNLAYPPGMFHLKSSFLSCEKDCDTILRKLFIENQPHSENLIRLLTINSKDCLENDSQIIKDKVKEMTINKLREDGYIKLEPKISFGEHEDVKAYILITFDSFLPSDNPEFRNCMITFDILCHTDYWDIGNFRLRPLKIAGYIDGLLNNQKLSGIGTLQFMGCTELVLDEVLSGYSLMFSATHGSDDKIDEDM